MTNQTHEFTWGVTGWLAGMSHEARLLVLGLGLGLGIIAIGVSYRLTLARIPPARRALLCALRCALWLAFLCILAAPTRLERTFDHPVPRPLGILVDWSGSMTARDNRQQRRIDDALQQWKRMESAARTTFPTQSVFAFAQGVKPVSRPEEAVNMPDRDTDFFASLRQTLAQASTGGWGGLVTLTDGLDTSGVESAVAQRELAHAALSAGTPLYFVVGRNRLMEPSFIRLKEWTMPVQSAPHSVVKLEVRFESAQLRDEAIPVKFTVDGKTRAVPPLKIEAGHHLTTWSTEIATGSAMGKMEIELEAGAEKAQSEITVSAPATRHVLYQTEAMDWGYRTLADILDQGNAFKAKLAVDWPKAQGPEGSEDGRTLSTESLKSYGVVILANARADRLLVEQQKTLVGWVREGGVLVFLSGDADLAQGFAGSELEKALPVEFARARSGDRGFFENEYDADGRVKLESFAWEKTPRVDEIFASTPETPLAEQTPRFSSFVMLQNLKPGAEVLARHPNVRGADGKGAILLAVQRFGRGQSAVLATDSLWRWKLSQPKTSRSADIFWHNLFSWLTRDSSTELAFDQPPFHATKGQRVTFKLVHLSNQPVKIEAVLGQQHSVVMEQKGTDDSREFDWIPPVEGRWRIEARSADGRTARSWVQVDTPMNHGEFSGAPPDEELLRALAAQTGGAVLENAPSAWGQPTAKPTLVAERREPLWDRAWIFALLLGIYALELILRRRYKLL